MLITLIVIVLFTLIGVIEVKKFYLNYTKLKNFYKLSNVPVIGLAYKAIYNDLFEVFSQPFPTDLLKFDWFFGTSWFLIDSPADAQIVLNSDKCINRPFPYRLLKVPGILVAPKHIWKPNRRALNPTFNVKMISTFIPIFNEKSKISINQVDRFVGQHIDLHKILFKKTVDEILTTQFGIKWAYQEQRADEIKILVDGYYECLVWRADRIHLKWDFLYSFTDCYKRQMKVQTKFFQFISSTREFKATEFYGKLSEDENELIERKEQNKLNFMEKCLWLERERQLTSENVLDELVTILVGGSNTSADTLLLILLMLAMHRDCQDLVVAELREIFESADDYVSQEHITNMKYMELVIKESVRLFPILPVMGRETDADLDIRGGTMPKGAMLIINVLKIQRDPKYWGENAHLFYPERFLPENSADVHPYAFIGFSAGPRNCIGAKYAWYSMKIFLASFLRRFQVTTDLKYKDLIIKSGMLLNVLNKNSVRIERRKW